MAGYDDETWQAIVDQALASIVLQADATNSMRRMVEEERDQLVLVHEAHEAAVRSGAIVPYVRAANYEESFYQTLYELYAMDPTNNVAHDLLVQLQEGEQAKAALCQEYGYYMYLLRIRDSLGCGN